MHTYVAAMIPQLARRLVDEYVPPGGIVLDPFCGGGAVLAEAVGTMRSAIGRDVNELAVLISKAKTTHVPEHIALTELNYIVQRIGESIQSPQVDSILAYWFKSEHLAPLHAIHQAIVHTVDKESPILPLFLTAFSATVRDVSLTYRNEIRLRRMSPEEVERFNVNPIERFHIRARKAIALAAQLPESSHACVSVGDVQSLDLPDRSVSAIVCSPPYGDERNGVSYAQFARNMLSWLGYSSQTLKRSKALTLGWGNSRRDLPVSPTLDGALHAISGFPASIREATAFYADYQVALKEMVRVTRGPIVVVIGPRVLRDTVFDNGAITVELMKNLGVSLTQRFCRKLPSKRLPRMRKFGAAIDREDILVFCQ